MRYDDYSFVFDIDGTICPIKSKSERYEDLKPYTDVVEKIRFYKYNGARIILFTSRNMNSYNGNLGLINKNTARILLAWLDKWDIPYDEIFYGKPWPGHKGFYVDDRAVRPDEFLTMSLDDLSWACIKSRNRIVGKRVPDKLDIVITMGGLGSRFRDAGYNIPKYMIEANGKTLFEWSIASLEGYFDIADQIVFVVLKDNTCDVKRFIEEKCNALKIKFYKIVMLEKLSRGQAETVMFASRYWHESNGLLIYNIDTYVEPYAMNSNELCGDGFIPCFKGEGNHWSFVKLDSAGKVIEIKEKERISNYCTLGAYYFSSCDLYKDLYNEFYDNWSEGEQYVAPLYDFLLKKGGKVYISDVNPDKVHVLGTPKELETFRKNINFCG